MSSSDLSVAAVQARLSTLRYGRSLELRAATDSTNDDAKRASESGAPEGHVIVAEAQRRGRGSQGRDWSSSEGDDLYLSIVDRPRIAFAALPPLTLAVGLGVAEAVDVLRGERGERDPSRVKWPNDVHIGGKKCAGILIEASASGEELSSLVIGIGLNVNRSAFPGELAGLATSLRGDDPAGMRIDRARALAVLLTQVEIWVDRFSQEGAAAISAALSSRLAWLGQRVRCGELRGIVRGVTTGGALRLETTSGMRELIAGRILHDDDG